MNNTKRKRDRIGRVEAPGFLAELFREGRWVVHIAGKLDEHTANVLRVRYDCRKLSKLGRNWSGAALLRQVAEDYGCLAILDLYPKGDEKIIP
jgi:hypothetical protein